MKTVLRRFEASDVAAFATATSDHNPIHLDDDVARQLGFAGAVVHGMLPVAAAMEEARQQRQALVQLQEVRFLAPILVGQELEIQFQVAGAGLAFTVTVDGRPTTSGLLEVTQVQEH